MPAECTLGASYELVPPNATADRVCAAVRRCRDDEYVTANATKALDYACARCPPGSAVDARANACAPCAAATYDHDADAATACEPCGAGFAVK